MKDTGYGYNWLEPNFEININEQVIETNKILRKNITFPVVDLHPLFIENNNVMNKMYSTDGIHLNKRGYLKWINKILPILNTH